MKRPSIDVRFGTDVSVPWSEWRGPWPAIVRNAAEALRAIGVKA